MINGTNLFGKDNPRWPIGNAAETIKVPDPRIPHPLELAPAWDLSTEQATGIANIGDLFRRTAGLMAAWLAGLPRRAGRRLFAMNDLEAGWRGWQVIELRGGLGRQYRDHRFDTLTPGGRPPGIPPAWGDSRPPIPPRPEAWDDHWDGRSLGSGRDDSPGCPLEGDA